ncbi:MAG: hypothetical protein JW712_07495, partial [Dehalococcoidales bacterium]|nr:hypothetical protein [Dehalococcoidales bacterium]
YGFCGCMYSSTYFILFRRKRRGIIPYLINRQYSEWRQKVLSLFTDAKVELDIVLQYLTSMPPELYREIEELLKAKHLQQAVRRLQQVPEYAENMRIHKGDIAYQMVRAISKQMKATK